MRFKARGGSLRFMGCPTVKRVVGGTYREVYPFIHPSGRHIWEEYPVIHPSGRHIWRIYPLYTPQGGIYMVVYPGI